MLRNATFRLSRNKDSGDGDLDPIVELATPSGSLSSGSRMCEGQRCPPDRIPFKSLDTPTQQKQVIVDVNGRNRMLLPSPMDQRKSTTDPMSKNSLFTNFEDVRLTDEEHVYLCAAGQGDVPILRQSLEEAGPSLNVNCVDYMGRSALHLSVDSENIEAVELLMEKIDFNCIEESLLHAISKGATKIVRAMIEHPSYMAEAEKNQRKQKDPFFRTDEKSQFSPDIDPLLLAAHQNNHEIIQLFLSRNFVIQRPHPISCQCADCVTKQNYDSLKRSRSRLNAYRALASPAYMALSSTDPIMTTFELRQEMKKLAQVEKEFKNEYMSLVEQCMTFACELMDLCRGTQEVEAVLSEADEDNGVCDPLARLKFAIEYEEKKFVAHPNCQQHLTNIWYGPEMGFMQSLNFWKKIAMWLTCIPLVPIFCILYVVAPGTKVGHALRCPASKFITHTLSHTCFLILLAAATFRLEEKTRIIANTTAAPALDLFDPACRPEEDDICRDKIDKLLKDSFRPANTLITNVQICLMFWIIGLLWIECKQIYNVGLRIYLLDNYNWMDFVILSLYMSSYFLRYLVDHWIKEADLHYNGTARAKEALFNHDVNVYKSIETQIFNDVSHKTHSYFMKALRFDWHSNDPEIVSDVLFAIANVLSIARTTFLMPAFEVLGPLQISLGRMLGDITRFLVLFTLVLFAFMVGLHNLYWYYGSQTYAVPKKDSKTDKLVHTSEAFQGLPRTLYSLFWSMFGLIPIDSVEIKYPKKELSSQYANNFPGGSHATSIVEGVGMFLFALYHVAIIIVLTNMLIAMMSHSFEAIQGDCDVEWKFARTKLWMNYIDEGSTLPVPFNMLPTPKSFRFAWRFLKIACSSSDQALLGYKSRKRQTFIEIQRERVCQMLQIEMPQTSYKEILQRLVKRYLFKLERMKEEGKEVVNPGTDSYVTTASQPGDGNANYANEIAIDASEDETDESHRSKPTSSTAASDTNPSRLNLWRQDASNKPNQPHQPPPPPSCEGTRLLRRTSRPSSVSSQFQPNQIQLVSLPQLDLVQRSLKVLDVRVQRLHTLAKEEDRLRQDTEHVLLVISENRKALGNVLLVLTSVQDEVRNLALAMKKQQSNTFTIRPPTTRGRLDSKRDSNLEMSSTGHVLPF